MNSPKPDRNGMSERGFGNVEAIMPKISAQVAERSKKTDFKIDLSTAENCLIRPEVVQIYKKAIQDHLEPAHLSYPKGFSGDPLLVSTLAAFFNTYFNPAVLVEPEHIITAPGAATCLDTMLFNICNPGDAVLVPGPYWNGFDFQFRVRSSVELLTVNVDDISDTFTMNIIPALEKAVAASTRPVRALVMTNPHNPFGRNYPRAILEECVKFCEKHKIHYISDEVYALSAFPNFSAANAPTFVSALSLDLNALGCDPSRVHTIWSTSKDFGSSGIRMGCIVTQSNTPLAVGAALAANTQTSSLSGIATVGLLSSAELPALMELNAARLAIAYDTITTFLTRHNLDFIPVTSGLYVFARLARGAQSFEDEGEMIAKIRDAGVLVSAGKAYHVTESEKGWARITFAVEPAELRKALDILEGVFSRQSAGPALEEGVLEVSGPDAVLVA